MSLKSDLLIVLLAFGLALSANAGSSPDADSDFVPDAFDNCLTDPNGPNNGVQDQLDFDLDGYGNRCDADYNNMNGVTVADFTFFVSCFSTQSVLCEHNGVGGITVADFTTFLRLLGPPSLTGPSGLPCAGTVPCQP